MSDTDFDRIIRPRVYEALDLLDHGGRRSLSDATEEELRRTIHACCEMCVEASKDAAE